jgi:hypothetical protein
MNYDGFGAWCAAYAFLNTTCFSKGEPYTYELLSGVPFGLKHRANDRQRMLTPLIEPCFRVEATATMLGYTTTMMRFANINTAISYIAQLPSGSRVMAGPVDMGYLTHLPQNLYYTGQSHYFSIAKNTSNRFIVIDSEGVLCYLYDEEALRQILNVECLPEADGLLNIWRFDKTDNYLPDSEYKRTILQCAASNLKKAEAEGQGSQAFIACSDALAGVDPTQWHLRLFFELNFVIQRKYLFSKRLRQWGAHTAHDVLTQQLHTLCTLREQTMRKEPINIDLFQRASDYERGFTQVIAKLAEMEGIV